MQLNKLGRSELKVSALGFGAMSLSLEDRLSDLQLIQTAYEEGIRYFDTADLYAKGENEKLLGEGIKEFRKDIVLATKVGNVWNEDGRGWGWNVSKAYIHTAIDASLKRLQTDYIDLYQLHGGTIGDDFDDVVDTFERLKEAGKIRAYGLSSIRPNVFKPYAQMGNMVSNMMQFSVLDTRPEEYLDFLEEQHVGIIGRGTLAQGMLIDKAAKEYLGLDAGTVADVQTRVAQVASEQGVSTIAVALFYVLRHGAVSSALIGARTVSQFNELMSAYREMEGLDGDKVAALGVPLFYTSHR
ncbi:aldo/keto reductase [Sphingobacterium paucimobilis]|uniref:NADP-dependent oxidoreductase domain-containing protein n=1 Tax=Sphingobacterium paucimobilis HER1398 TaxID=1346330 RepID=U2J4U5_9SPHI|nr:aldo/keto reductase [Sphingobacterium paucimobilis]ERJ59969.1 hypothetical protein M472_14465 [Sphingobacterium paucimobilis HER1398]